MLLAPPTYSHHLSQAEVYLPTFLLFAEGLPSVVRAAKTDEKNY
jgi:hypothetical protein